MHFLRSVVDVRHHQRVNQGVNKFSFLWWSVEFSCVIGFGRVPLVLLLVRLYDFVVSLLQSLCLVVVEAWKLVILMLLLGLRFFVGLGAQTIRAFTQLSLSKNRRIGSRFGV